MSSVLKLTPVQAARFQSRIKGRVKRANTWNKITPERQQKAIHLYKKTGSKNHVCKELRMGRNTLNKILESEGVL